MRNAEVSKGGERADRGRNQIIRDEQKCADDGNDLAAMSHTRVDAAAVRIEAADDHVIDPNQRDEHAHQRDQPERSIAGHRESEANDIGFARTPVAVKNCSRARHIDIARTLNISCYQLDSNSTEAIIRATKRLHFLWPL